MRLSYRYRWIYAFVASLCMLLAGYVYVVQPKLEQLREIEESKRNLRQALVGMRQLAEQNKKNIPPPMLPLTEEKRLSQLFMQLRQLGLSPQSVLNKSLKNELLPEGVMLQITARGSFQQIAAFIRAASQKNYPLLIIDFSIHEEKKNLLFVVNLLLLKTGAFPDLVPIVLSTQNPICEGVIRYFSPDDELAMQMTSLYLMKMVGVLAQGQRKLAFLSLPDLSIATVEEGAFIGKEYGVVTAIHPKRIRIRLPNHYHVDLKLE
jgi:Tfp pilus assembly protein PilO